MKYMFLGAAQFSRDLSSWCVDKIEISLNSFDLGSALEDHPDQLPVWGSCPEKS